MPTQPSFKHRLPVIKGFIETSFVDWAGKIAAVVFLPGCNFRCPMCHNHELVLHPEAISDYPLDVIVDSLNQHQGWIDGVCITGGEPTNHPNLDRLLTVFKALGLPVKLDTNGSRPDVLAHLLAQGQVDYVAMDVKSQLNDISYSQVIGGPAPLASIKQSLELIRSGGVDYEFRTTVVPGLHRLEDIQRLAEQLAGAKRWRIQNFSPAQTLDPEYLARSPFPAEEFAVIKSYELGQDRI
ncbi:MAG: anaerobic ribonucleoside-triphosphate reductase activating protein [Deltaproteobacteria bacterium]|nr:anaerobic ribonucleoside-triphosphate reductase activating protein [Deltaproteobacteria bacterium]